MDNCRINILGAMLLAVLISPLSAQPSRTILVQKFDPAPDGQGGSDTNFDSTFNRPVLNDNGEVAFATDLVNGFNGVFRTDGTNTVQIARWGDPAPDGSGSGEGFFNHLLGSFPWINAAGEVAFSAGIVDSAGVSQGQGIWVGNGINMEPVVRSGEPAPDGNGTFPASVHALIVSGFNDAGEVAFNIRLDGTAAGTDDDDIIVRGTTAGLVTIAREGTGFDSVFGSPLLNEQGQVFFEADIDSDEPGTQLYLGDGSSTSFIAGTFDAPSPGGYEFTSFRHITHLNAAGEVAFEADRQNEEFEALEPALFRGGPGGIERLAVLGGSAPDGDGGFDGTFSDFSGRLPLNDLGQVVFNADLEGASDGFAGLFRTDGSELIAIVRMGDPAPDGNGTFNNLTDQFAIDALGRVIFTASLTGTTGGSADDFGIFLYDDVEGLITVAREGGTLEGATLQQALAWLPPVPIQGVGFNDVSVASFSFLTTAGNTGVARFDPDLPTEPPSPPVEDCQNGTDDDGDGLVDGDDPDCQEDCTNGIDDDGDGLADEEDPQCIDPVVRCFHDPVYAPASGEIITIKAETIDREGAELQVDAIEIYLGFDRNQPQQVVMNSSSASLEFPPPDDFSYACRAKNGGMSNFTGWRQVVVGDLDFSAIPVVFNEGPLNEKIDIVFFPDEDEYTSHTDPDFIEDVGLLISEGFGTVPTLLQLQSWFNFWIGKDSANSGPDPNDDRNLCLREAPDNFNLTYAFADSAGIVHRSECRDNAGSPGIFTIEMNLERLQVVVHEAGHRPFGLADEYCCDGGYYTNSIFGKPPFPNLFKREAGCRNAAAERGFDSDDCRELFAAGPNWWLFEPDFDKLNPEPWDWMQGEGCAAYDNGFSACSLQLQPEILGSDADPNGLHACSEIMDAYRVDPNSSTACSWDLDDEMPCLWLCRSPGTAAVAEWIPSRGTLDRLEVGSSEIDRLSWFLEECSEGEC